MSTNNFVLQGLTAHTHIEAVNWLLDTPNIRQVILGIAFVNESGVCLVEEKLRGFASKTKIFCGIRNDITSRQGLERLIKMGIEVYVVDTGARNIIFHPKVYLAQGAKQARLIIGSANLTSGGLNNNIEASVTLSLDLGNDYDKKFVESIKSQLLDLPGLYAENVFKVTEAQLNGLQSSGRLLDEAEASPPRPAAPSSPTVIDSVSRIKLKVTPAPRIFRHASVQPAARRNIRGTTHTQIRAQLPTNLELVWQSTPLTRRDLNIPNRKGTHITGAMSLDKGLLQRDIDYRSYFRRKVFAHLNWVSGSQDREKAVARFQLIVKGIYIGEFSLHISHNVSTSSESYKQHNAMTDLKWGAIREYISHPNLIGRTLSIYRDETDPMLFVLEID